MDHIIIHYVVYRFCLTNDFCVKTKPCVWYVEEDVAKSPPSSPASPQNTAFVSSSKSPSSQPDSSEVSLMSSKTLAEDDSAPSSLPLQQQQQQQPLVNGKSSSSPVNGVAPVRHENGTNKNIEIDIPPGTL